MKKFEGGAAGEALFAAEALVRITILFIIYCS